MFDANFFGMVAMIKKVLPGMRERRDGAIVNVSSIGAVRTGAASGYYAATKAAVELMTEGLAAEVAPLGIKAMIVEPGAFRTHFYDSSLKGSDNTVGDYAETAHKRSVAQNVNTRQQPGDPLKAGYPIIKAIEADDTPLRLYLGSDALAAVRGALNARLEELEKWAEVSVTTDFDRLCRTGSAVLIDAGHDRTGDAVTITARFRIVRKRRIDRLVKERRTARLAFLLCHTAANIDPVCIASPCRIM